MGKTGPNLGTATQLVVAIHTPWWYKTDTRVRPTVYRKERSWCGAVAETQTAKDVIITDALDFY